MSYQEKRTLANLVLGGILLIAYGFFTWGRYQSGTPVPGDIQAWAIALLWFIGSSVLITIVVQIIFHIFLAISIAIKERHRSEKEIGRVIEATTKEDEMDKLIELKSSKVGFFLAGLGFVVALAVVALGHPAEAFLHITFYAFGIGSFLEGLMSLYYYRKGLVNG